MKPSGHTVPVEATGETDPVQELVGRTIAGYFTDVTGRTEPESGDLDLAFDIHQALLAAAPGTISPVLELHRPIRRYQAGSRLDTLTYPTAERAYQANLDHSMRGFETLVMAGPDDVPFIELCAECSRVENSFDQGDDAYGDDHDDHQDGSWLSSKASAWPCATYAAVASGAGSP